MNYQEHLLFTINLLLINSKTSEYLSLWYVEQDKNAPYHYFHTVEFNTVNSILEFNTVEFFHSTMGKEWIKNVKKRKKKKFQLFSEYIFECVKNSKIIGKNL